MKKLFILSVIIILPVLKLSSQEKGACFSFKEETYNFGSVKEEGGPINHVFEFTNIGGTPLIINNVQASCGCTTPDWSRQPIPPGGKGFVKATFNPSGRPGSFSKTITITSNATCRPTVTISFSGTVIGKVTTTDIQFTFPMDSLMFQSSHLGFETLNPGMIKTNNLQFINKSRKNVTIGVVNVPPFLNVSILPTVVKPGEIGKMMVSYNTTLRKDWDFLVDYLYLNINGKQDPHYKITITATIDEDFTKLTPIQLANAPKIKFEKGFYDFGTVKSGEKLEFSFPFKNEGKSDLILRKIEKTCACTTVVIPEKTIQAGNSGSIQVTLDTHGQSGSLNKAITITTNDPDNRKMILYVRGTIN